MRDRAAVPRVLPAGSLRGDVRLLPRYLLTLFFAALGLVAGLLLLSRPARAIAAGGQSEKLPAALQLNELAQRSVVYDREGNVLAVLHVDENRSPVTLDQVPPHVVQAVLDVEDDSFYEHSGVNLRSILRAALTNVESGSVRQGGSTITQQLVKQSLLTPERDIGRKAKEAVLALRLEQQMSKDEILERYLNTVYLGNTAYGVQAAAETYRGKNVQDLTVEEGAFLAGLIRNPVGYDPFKKDHRAELAQQRRDLALDRMVVRHHLTPEQAAELKKIPIPTSPPDDAFKTAQDYFVEEVEQHLLDDKRLGSTQAERYTAIFRGGLRIETTFDPRLQEIAQRQIDTRIPDTKGRYQAALISIEPKTGAVRAMVAGKDYASAQYNLATGRGGSGRQPGSSFKPIVLTAALEKGIGPEDTINGSEPCPVRIEGVEPNPYEPGNYEGSKGGNGPIAQATARSLNCAFVRLGLALDDNPFKSMDKVAAMARRLGIPIPDDGKYGPSISLGAKEATPLQMASVYGTFANDGVRHEPYFVERVLDRNGKVVLEGKDEGKRVLDANVARTVTSVLRGVVDGGTGTKARQKDRVVAGKTGTSQEWRNAWFIGYTRELVTATWMGNPLKDDPMKNVGGIRVTGGSYPAAFFGAYEAEAMKGVPPSTFPAPDLSKYGKPEPVKLSKESGTSGATTTVKHRRRTTSTTSASTSGEGGDGTTATTAAGTG
jgi:penicillin-binding protein 1A